MGFGILLLGYFLTFAFTLANVYFFADVIGVLIMLYAFSKLSEYNLYFRWAAFCGIAFTVLALGNALCITMHLVKTESWLDIGLDAVKSVAALGMQMSMLLGIRGISLGAEYEKLAEKAVRNMGMLGVYYVLYFVVLFTARLYPDTVSYVSFLVYVYWFICFICILLLIHSCFGMFYPGDGEDPMENRRSRIPLFNKISDAFDKLEEKSNRYREESMRMAMAEAEKKAAEKRKQKKKKKKK